MVSSGRYLSYRLAVCTNMSGLWKMKGLLEMQHYSGAVQWVSWFNLCLRGSFPVPFWSLSVLMMDSCRCMCDTHTLTRSHTNSGICHLFVSTFIYFPWFFYTLQFVWEKWGDAHTACLSSVYVVCVGRGWGMFFSRGESNPMKAVFPLLWTTFSPSAHSAQ